MSRRSADRRGPWVLAALAATASLVVAAPAAAKGGLAEVASGARATWFAHPGKGLLRLDYGATAVSAPLDVGRSPTAVAALHGVVWSVALDGTLARVDEVGNRVERRVRLGLAPADVAVTERSVWVVGDRQRPHGLVLLRIDPDTARVRGAFHLGARAARLAVGHGAVWLAFHPRSRRDRIGLVGIDEATGRLRFRRRIDGIQAGVAVGREAVWLLAHRRRRSRLVGVDPRAGTRIRAIDGPPDQVGDIAAGADLLWLTTLCGGVRCNIARASARGYEQRSGQLVAGPFLLGRCRTARGGPFVAGLTAHARTALVLVGDGRGGLAMADVLPRRGTVRCVDL